MDFDIRLSSIPESLQYSELQLCDMNIFYYHWLTKMLLWSMAGKNIARQEN